MVSVKAKTALNGGLNASSVQNLAFNSRGTDCFTAQDFDTDLLMVTSGEVFGNA